MVRKVKTDQGDIKPGCFGAIGYKTREQVQDGCFDCELIDECRKELYEQKIGYEKRVFR